jgi:hypothetical protein
MITKKWFLNKVTLIGVLFALLSIGCTQEFEKWNTNQNQATAAMLTEDDLTTGSFFVQMEKNVFPIPQEPNFGAEVYQEMQNLCGDIYSGYMGASGLWYSNANNTTYDLIPNWCSQAFSRGFVGVMPAWNAIKVASQNTAPQEYCMATIVKVEALHRIADMYGPLPYINFGNGALTNPYNDLKSVYYKFFDELNMAIDTLTTFNVQNPSATPLASYDFIFHGNVVEWIKFANTLKLRLAMRIVYADPTKAQEEAESAVNNSIGVFTSVTDVALLQQSGTMTYDHPLWTICYNFGETRMGANMDSYLNGYSDPRISAYFDPSSAGDYRGIRNGINITVKATYSAGPFSTLNISEFSPIIWMGPAEAYFLRAEGALRGWKMGDTPQNLYNAGITTSFSYWGVSGASTYINSTSLPAAYTDPENSANNVPIGSSYLSTIPVKWLTAGTFEQNLEQIITQKWIAGFPDGQEAWSEFRRTGYPKVFPVVVNLSPGGIISTTNEIRRLPFSSTEYANNPSGVAQGISELGGPDNGGTKLWWDNK